MTPRQRDLVLWLGRAGHCGPNGIVRAGWSRRTIDRCADAGWIEISPDHRYSYRPTPAGMKEALR